MFLKWGVFEYSRRLHRGRRASRHIRTRGGARLVNSVVVSSRDKVGSMAKPLEIITAAEMDKMTPQQRADAVDASIVHSWDDVDPAFRRGVEQRAAELAKTLGADA